MDENYILDDKRPLRYNNNTHNNTYLMDHNNHKTKICIH